jgi:hypothetical protein
MYKKNTPVAWSLGPVRSPRTSTFLQLVLLRIIEVTGDDDPFIVLTETKFRKKFDV